MIVRVGSVTSRRMITVVAATHDREHRLVALLESLRRQTVAPESFEVVVVDDGSRDGTAAALEREVAAGGLTLRVLRLHPAGGPSAARDAGWRLGDGDLVVFTDDDCVATPTWLAEIAAAWDGNADRIVQGRVDPNPAELADEGPWSRTLRVRQAGPHYQTANIAYPRALLERVDGFDTGSFSMAGEDTDLAWRCLEVGAHPVYAADAVVHHAVHQLGPVGKLRVAARWHEAMKLYAIHPGYRSTLTYRIFWKKTHYLLLRAMVGLVLPRRGWLGPLRFWCLAPIAPAYLHRAREEGGRQLAAPYFVLHDLVEMGAAVRGAVRHRVLVL